MAGESPDRSKQRESSAEPTPGGGNPVPEARDPRLAVARATTDTATKVLSTREEPPAGEDARLRAAVAAWVRTGSGEPEPEPSGGDAATDTAPETNPETHDDSEPGDGNSPETATGAKPEPATEADPKAKPEAATGVDSEAEPETAVGADSKDGPKAATRAAAGANTKAEPAAATEAASEDKPEAATRAAAGANSEDGPEAATEADPEDKPEAATRAAAGAGSKAKPEPATEAGSKAEPEAAAEADSEAKPEASTGAEAEAKPEAATGAAAEAKPEAATEAASGAGSKEKPAAAAGAGSEVEAGSESGGAGEPEAAAGSGSAVAEGVDEVEDAPEDQGTPADGDGAKAPQDAPAPDGESRADGPGGSGSAEDEPVDDAPQDPVDHPTAVFKAPRPQVDQPTTTLKIGGAARTARPPQAPRPSEFVALKPLDDPATRKPPSDATTAFPRVGPERTTQQPLPPKPPLDLLAELTNTPPPPQTPVRTLVRRIKIWTPLVILLAIIFAVVQSVRPLPRPTLDLTAQDSFTFDGGKVDIPWPSQGQAALDVQGIGTFGSNGDQKPVPIASVAKVMTAYVILRDHPLKSGAEGPEIKIDQAAEDQSKAGQESTVDVTAGDSVTQREALESILIASANNVARLLARWDAGSEKAFVAKMNATAKDLGMTNTTYTDPSGLTDSTVSTAVDQVKLAKAAMGRPAFREVAAMMSYDDYKGVNHSNWNQLVGHNDVVGIKTGTTTSALGNLVFAAKKDVGGETRTIVGAVLRQPAGGPENTILSAALYGGDQLIRAAQGALRSATILKKGAVVGYVADGLGGRTPVVATKDVTAAGWSGLKVKLSFTSDVVPHTAKAGTKVGTLTVGDGSGGAVAVPVALQKDLTEPGFSDKLTRLG